MRLSKWIVVGVLLSLLIMFAYFSYMQYSRAKNLPADVEGKQEFRAAVKNALRMRYPEATVSFFLFPLVGWSLALLRLPRLSWLRNLIAAVVVAEVVHVVVAFLMERELQVVNAAWALPLEGVVTALLYALYGVAFAALLFFVSERVHEWGIARHDS